MNEELTIVIPAKNEEPLIGRLLESLCGQDYEQITNTRVFVADASSSDRTREVAESFAGRLRVQVIQGGTPSQGRNAGARLARSKYILFVDADVTLGDRGLVKRSVAQMNRGRLHCATTFILSAEKTPLANLMYLGNNLIQLGSKLSTPFSPGAFTMFERERFFELGGFDERVLYAEDYFLSRKIDRKRFGVVPGWISTTDRRFKRMGHFRFIGLFIKTVANSGNDAYFFQDHRYWD